MPLDAVVVSGHIVCGYASNPKTDEAALARHIKDILKDNHYDKMTVKIFHDYTAFLSRAEGMNNMTERIITKRKKDPEDHLKHFYVENSGS